MNQQLIASIEDIPLLHGYLHDASFTPSDIKIDSPNSIFELKLRRIYYEGAKRGKFLFLLPVIRYPHVLSLLRVTEALSMKEEWKDNAFSGPDDLHTLLDIELKEDNRIEMKSEYLILHIGFSANSRLIVEDLSEPETKRSAIDFGRSIFRGLQEIDKLRTPHNKTINPTGNSPVGF